MSDEGREDEFVPDPTLGEFLSLISTTTRPDLRLPVYRMPMTPELAELFTDCGLFVAPVGLYGKFIPVAMEVTHDPEGLLEGTLILWVRFGSEYEDRDTLLAKVFQAKRTFPPRELFGASIAVRLLVQGSGESDHPHIVDGRVVG